MEKWCSFYNESCEWIFPVEERRENGAKRTRKSQPFATKNTANLVKGEHSCCTKKKELSTINKGCILKTKTYGSTLMFETYKTAVDYFFNNIKDIPNKYFGE